MRRDLSSQPGFVTRVLDEPLALDPDTELSKIAFRFFHFDPTFGPAGKTAVTIFDTGGRYAAGDQAADLAVQHSGGISWGRDAQGAANIPACEPIFGVAEGAANVSKGFYEIVARPCTTQHLARCRLMEWPGRAPTPPETGAGMGRGQTSTAMSNKSIASIAPMGIDIGKNSFHVVGLDRRAARSCCDRSGHAASLKHGSPQMARSEKCSD